MTAGVAPASSGSGPDWAHIYGLDLVYEKDCWKLCGDAHCCNFARHKSRFKFMGKKPFQELPLLPGEYEFMRDRGWLAQFQDHVHKKQVFALDGQRAMTIESIVSHRPGCACDHATRPTICRLYPLFPVLDIEGRITGIETHFGIYEELENLEGVARACKIGGFGFDQLAIFLELVGKIAASPLHLFHLMAYRIAKRHAFDRLRQTLAANPQSAFELFEWQMLRGRLFDIEAIRGELSSIARQFEARFGTDFRLPAASPAVA